MRLHDRLDLPIDHLSGRFLNHPLFAIELKVHDVPQDIREFWCRFVRTNRAVNYADISCTDSYTMGCTCIQYCASLSWAEIKNEIQRKHENVSWIFHGVCFRVDQFFRVRAIHR